LKIWNVEIPSGPAIAADDHRRGGVRGEIKAIAAGAAGGAVAIAIMELLSARSMTPLMTIPFATSIVLIMGTPQAEPAQPRALVGGHLIATLIGLLVVKLAGPGPWAAAVAVGLAMLAMHLTDTFHPPAGINPLLVVVNDFSWNFLAIPVAVGAVLLLGFAFAWHNLIRRSSWPKQWW
jgi:CBS-domain-containing membrane protein